MNFTGPSQQEFNWLLQQFILPESGKIFQLLPKHCVKQQQWKKKTTNDVNVLIVLRKRFQLLYCNWLVSLKIIRCSNWATAVDWFLFCNQMLVLMLVQDKRFNWKVSEKKSCKRSSEAFGFLQNMNYTYFKIKQNFFEFVCSSG